MANIKRILVPTDFSEAAGLAVRGAAALAKETRAELLILHVLDVSPVLLAGGAGYLPATAFEELEQRAMYGLEAVTARVLEAGVAAKSVFSVGPPAQTILEVADREAAQLIVMGTHGRSGVRRLVLGSIAERVARGARVPVMAVRAAPQQEGAGLDAGAHSLV